MCNTSTSFSARFPRMKNYSDRDETQKEKHIKVTLFPKVSLVIYIRNSMSVFVCTLRRRQKLKSFETEAATSMLTPSNSLKFHSKPGAVVIESFDLILSWDYLVVFGSFCDWARRRLIVWGLNASRNNKMVKRVK